MSTPKILDQVKKLLQLAGPGNSAIEEARSAAHRAVALILEHKIVLSLAAAPAPFPGSFEDDARSAPYRRQPSAEPPPPRYDPIHDWAPPPGGWMGPDPPIDHDPPPPHRDARSFRSSAEYTAHINAMLDWMVRDQARKETAKAAKAARAAAAARDADVDLGADDVLFGPQRRELRRRQQRAWRRAGRPMKTVVNEETGELVETPDFSGLSL